MLWRWLSPSLGRVAVATPVATAVVVAAVVAAATVAVAAPSQIYVLAVVVAPHERRQARR